MIYYRLKAKNKERRSFQNIIMERFKKILTDFIYGSLGLAAMNAVLNLVVYPMLGRTLGAAMHGRILFFTSLAGLAGATFGSGANYGRLKIFSEERETENGEYNRFLLIAALILLIASFAAVLVKKDSANAGVIGVFALVFSTTVRHYADVGFRLKLKYGHFSLYYAAMAVGYLAGLLLYRLIPHWLVILLSGELFALLYAVIFSDIFRAPFFRKTAAFKKHLKTLFSISGSFLLSDAVSAADRMLLPLFLANGDELSSLYYYASIVGKIVSLVSSPLNGVLSGHISRQEKGLSRKTFLKITLLLSGLFVIVTGAAYFVSHLFVRLFYADYYEKVRSLFLLANAGQVIFFICNTMMVLVLRFTHERNQVIINVIYVILFFAITIPLILTHGVTGMAAGIFITNTLKFLLYAGIGFFSLKKEENS